MPQSETPYAQLTLSAFTQAVASPQPVPGGGSVSAVTAAMAASLVSMVANLSMNRPKYAAYTTTHERAAAAGDQARTRFLELADEDARAFAQFAAAMKLPRETDDQKVARMSALDHAAHGAADVPLQVVRACHALARDVEALTGRSNLNASSDLDVAALLTDAAARGAGANVAINTDSFQDQAAAGAMLAEVKGLVYEISEITARVHEGVRSGHLREPERA